MTLVKHDYRLGDPFNDMDRLYDRSLMMSDFFPNLISKANRQGSGGGLPINLYEDSDAYYLMAELPGVKREDIDLQLENAILTIDAKRVDPVGADVQHVSFTRSITIGDDVNSETVTAKLEEGILRVTLPKTEERKPKSIAIG